MHTGINYRRTHHLGYCYAYIVRACYPWSLREANIINCWVASFPAYPTPNATLFESKPRKILSFYRETQSRGQLQSIIINYGRSAIGAERPFLIPSIYTYILRWSLVPTYHVWCIVVCMLHITYQYFSWSRAYYMYVLGADPPISICSIIRWR